MNKPEGAAEDEKYKAPALAKGIDILELLASTPEGLTLGEVAKLLGRTNSEIFRMIVVLRQRGYVELGGDDRYSLTTKMFEVAHRHSPVRRLTAIAGEAIQKLAYQINQSVHLCILNSGKLLVIAQADCAESFIATVRLGAQIPIYDSASGRVLAAFMDEEALNGLLSLAGDASDKSRTRFLADLPAARAAGYFEGNSRNIGGLIDLSAPVFDFTGKVIAAVTSPYISRLNTTADLSVTEARECLIATCRDMSRRLGAGVAG